MSGSDTLEHPPPTAPIDPRIRARRIEVQRTAGRRRLQRLADVAVVGTVGLAFAAALWSPLLDVDEIAVHGADHTTPALVAAALGISPGDRLVGVDLQAAGQAVVALPWVERATLHRQLDGTVTVDVVERTAVARVGTGAGAQLVDRSGRVLGPAAEGTEAEGMTELVGVDRALRPGQHLPAATDAALALAERAAVAAPGAVATLDVETLTGTLTQGGEVRFGASAPLEQTASALRTALAQVDLSCLALLDLRSPGHVVLTREEGCS